MSRDVKPNNSSLVSSSSDPSKQRQTEVEATSTTTTTTLVSSKVEESDEDLFTVPDVETQLPQAAGSSTSALNNATTDHPITCNSNNNQQQVQPEKRRRGRNPVDKEYRRFKRLLRNRVSAQQARERKKVYVSDLESRAKELQDMNAKLEEKISTLIKENTMLRKVLMNTRPKADESKELK